MVWISLAALLVTVFLAYLHWRSRRDFQRDHERTERAQAPSLRTSVGPRSVPGDGTVTGFVSVKNVGPATATNVVVKTDWGDAVSKHEITSDKMVDVGVTIPESSWQKGTDPTVSEVVFDDPAGTRGGAPCPPPGGGGGGPAPSAGGRRPSYSQV